MQSTHTGTKATPTWGFSGLDDGWNDSNKVRSYFHNSELQRQWADELMAKSTFRQTDKVLDFGCGDGKISASLSYRVPEGHVTAVDLSKDMVAFAKAKFPTEHFPNLKYYAATSTDFSEGYENTFDSVFSFCVFHLIPNPKEVLENLKTALKPGGRLHLLLPSGDNPLLFKATLEAFKKHSLPAPFSQTPQGKPVASLLNEAGAIEILNDIGLKAVHIHKGHRPNAFINKSELVDWMCGTLTSNWAVDPNVSPALFTDLVDFLVEFDPSSQTSDGGILLKYTHMEIIAEK